MIWVIAATLIYGALSAATPADGGIYFHLLCDCIFYSINSPTVRAIATNQEWPRWVHYDIYLEIPLESF